MIELTLVTKSDGPLTKRISLISSGTVISDGSACVMARGSAKRVRLPDCRAFAEMLDRLAPNEAITLGSLYPDLPERVEITTKARLGALNGAAHPGIIARTSEHIGYRTGQRGLALLDVDTKGMPSAIRDRVQTIGGYREALVSVLPDLTSAASVLRASTSSGLYRADTGQKLPGSGGVHWFIAVQDASDIERFLRAFHARCWLAGFGWLMVGAGGQLLERSLIDRMVGAPERLVFEGAPEVVSPLAQDWTTRAPLVFEGVSLDTRAVCADLTAVEQAKVRAHWAAAAERIAPQVSRARAQFISEQSVHVAERLGVTRARAARMVEEQCQGVLLPGIGLSFDADDLAGATVADVLADPDRFVGATLADPLEGIGYGRCKAKVLRRADGTVWINSFAHGRSAYELRYDAGTIEAALRRAAPEDAADLFVRMAVNASLHPDEEIKLRDLTAELSGAKARPLNAALKAARARQAEQQAAAERERRAATRDQSRLQLPAPLPDAERLPVLRTLDEVLSGVTDPEPPMRDADGRPVEVRSRSPLFLHQLTSQGANDDEPDKTRLPPPELPLLTPHDRFSLAHEIERFIEFTTETKADVRSVALPPVFVEHYLGYRDSRLPRVGAVVTAPLVLADGTLLALQGLDRERRLVFRIEPKLLDLLPKSAECSPDAVAGALDFLTNEWLCDVSTDFAGKCVLIAGALTIIERVLLPERPAFFVTAGKRGGGKTTALIMLILAVTGKKPAAAAWSSNEEERRKAILSYLADGMAALIWDNIPLGTTIACPTLEKVLTADTFSDRILGASNVATVPATTIQCFTGNNIAPKGDMASRSLVARLCVDRPDPENRPFRHADPIAWTLDHRGAILKALYSILLGNRQFHCPSKAKTRFKTWWHLVGAAVEYAAARLVHQQQRSLPAEERTAKEIDFGTLFASVEDDDEDSSGLANVLDALRGIWRAGYFKSSDVVRVINDSKVGEDDHAAALRGYFEPPGRRQTQAVTAKSVGKRLVAMTDAPVWVGDQTMKLIRARAGKAQKRPESFKVEVV